MTVALIAVARSLSSSSFAGTNVKEATCQRKTKNDCSASTSVTAARDKPPQYAASPKTLIKEATSSPVWKFERRSCKGAKVKQVHALMHARLWQVAEHQQTACDQRKYSDLSATCKLHAAACHHDH